jgi:hypothetical protein
MTERSSEIEDPSINDSSEAGGMTKTIAHTTINPNRLSEKKVV